MNVFWLILLAAAFCTFPLGAQNSKTARRGTAKSAAELSAIAREIRITRHAREQLEDQAGIIAYAVKHEQLGPNDLRRIQGILSRIEKLLDRAGKNGKMSVSEAQTLRKELSRAYRTIWFLRRNNLDKGQKIIFFGRRIVLREEYRKKFESGSLNQKEMKEILHAYYSACRTREQLRTDSLKPEHRLRLERECFEILSEYFTLAQPSGNPPEDQRKQTP